MTTQPDINGPATGTWAWAVQRELDSLQRTMEQRYTELATRMDKVVSATEYGADKRAAAQQQVATIEKLTDLEKDIQIHNKDVSDSIERLRILISDEKKTRERERKEDQEKKQAQNRYIISAILLPIIITIIQLVGSMKMS